MDILLIVTLGVLGALLGSFAAAQVWRLRARQLIEDERDGEPVDKRELQRLRVLQRPVHRDRSECLHCHHTLAWYDLLPVISWLSLRGKCRYCGKRIGTMELAAEVGLAVVFVLSYLAWPYALHSALQVAAFIVWLAACTLGAILLMYDAKWSLLPFGINCTLIAVAAGFVALQIAASMPVDGVSMIGAVALLGGLYLLFSLLGWVGMGDGILGVGLGLLLGDWQLAFLTLFLANLLGCLMLIPLYVRKKLHRKVKIPFGPFLIVAAFISFLYGKAIILAVFGTSSLLTNLLML